MKIKIIKKLYNILSLVVVETQNFASIVFPGDPMRHLCNPGPSVTF
jgi:hypothetical protein